MDRKKNIPQIRFQNYEDEWVYSTIGRHISLLNGRAYKQEELLDEGKYRVLRVGNFNTNSKWYYSNLELEDNKYVNKGDLLYLWATNFGPEIWTEEKAIYHYHIWKLEFDKTDINQDYLYIWLESDKNKIQQNTNGSTMVHITKNMMEERRISLPSQDEQTAIGSLFRTLDDLLASYKDNLANYQSLKATMLSKMFPKAGQTVPEIRLDGFEGKWEVVNLGTLIENYDEIISGASGFPIATSSRKGLYLQNDYFEGGRTGIDLTLDFHRVPMGYVTYRHMSDDSIFKFNKNNFETDVLVSKEYPVFISNDRSDIDFLLYHFNNSRLFLRFSTMQKLGGTRVRLYYKNLITYKLSVPTVKEQQAIGAYFSNLDNLIAAQQDKISQLETLKKKLLQDMFIWPSKIPLISNHKHSLFRIV